MLSLIPISDANPTRRFPLVTIALIALNVAFFFTEPGFGQTRAANAYFIEVAPIPCQIEADCPAGLRLGGGFAVPIPERGPLSYLAASLHAMFLHAGFLHIAGNMLFLWVFGNNVEDFLGRARYAAFYLGGGIAASLAHTFTHLDSVLPAVGASGAVAAVMGAYLVLYPHARVNVLVPIFVFLTVIPMSAFAVLGLWFVYQFLLGAQELAGAGGVAWMAHVGGFVFGVVGILALGGRPQRPRPYYQPWGY